MKVLIVSCQATDTTDELELRRAIADADIVLREDEDGELECVKCRWDEPTDVEVEQL